MTENIAAKPATIVRTDNGPEAVEVRRQRDADYVMNNGGMIYGSLAEAEGDLVRAKSTSAVFSKKSRMVVTGWPVLMLDPEHPFAEGAKVVKAAPVEKPAPVVEEAPAETAKERRNRKARERRAAKKAAASK